MRFIASLFRFSLVLLSAAALCSDSRHVVLLSLRYFQRPFVLHSAAALG